MDGFGGTDDSGGTGNAAGTDSSGGMNSSGGMDDSIGAGAMPTGGSGGEDDDEPVPGYIESGDWKGFAWTAYAGQVTISPHRDVDDDAFPGRRDGSERSTREGFLIQRPPDDRDALAVLVAPGASAASKHGNATRMAAVARK